MASEKIIVYINPGGGIEIEGEGFSGPACDKALRELAESLGTVEEVRKKPEWFAAQAHAQKRTA